MKDDRVTLGTMVKKILGWYLAVDFMMLFINLPFTALVTSTSADGNVTTPRVIPCVILGSFTLLIHLALTVGYMGPVGEKLHSPFNEAPVDKFLALKAAAIVFALPFVFSAFTALTGAGVFMDLSFYEGMRFPHNLLYGPVFGFLLAFYQRSWLTPFFPPLVMVCVVELSYWIILKGFKLPRIFYRRK